MSLTPLSHVANARHVGRRACLLGTVVLLSFAGAGPAVSQVTSADDVCAPAADPCTITTPISTGPNAVLDFGTRALVVTGSGRIDVGDNNLTVRCGQFTLNRTGVALRIGDGSVTTIEVRRRCSGNSSILCTADSDCSGAVPAAGSCTVGDGSVSLGARVNANAIDPGFFSVNAAGDISVSQQITANGTTLDSDGAVVSLTSGGTIRVTDFIEVTSGGASTGGDIELRAADDIDVDAPLTATGGDFDGGTIEIVAGGDVLISNDMDVSATVGEGFGGSVSIGADGDIEIVGGTSGNRLLIAADGSESAENFGGDGGPVLLTAGGDIVLGEFVRITSNGAPPDGFGEEVVLNAVGGIVVEGNIESRGRGGSGVGGRVAFISGGPLEVRGGAQLDLTGGDGAGQLDLESGGFLTFAGDADLLVSTNALSGSVLIESADDLLLSGQITLGGSAANASPENARVEACRPEVGSTGLLDNRSDGQTRIIGRERVTVSGGGRVLGQAAGSNILEYRTDTKPPVILGTVSPAPTLEIKPNLQGCPVCGNFEVDAGESCDDGNFVSGDGCTSECQDEVCIEATPGWPSIPLCDDGNVCTEDVCTEGDGCFIHLPISGPCNDGVACTFLDECSGGVCDGVEICPPGQFCSRVTGQCEISLTTTTTTTTIPDGEGFCGDGVVAAPEQCDDGDVDWQAGEFCNASCAIVACGDPDDSGTTTATDALLLLRVAVALGTCDACLCDVDDSGGASPVSASDALRLLRLAVSLPTQISCPSCM